MTAVPSPPQPEAALSPSRALDFRQCPLLFRFRVIDRIPESPRPEALRGTLVHAVLDALFALPADRRTTESALGLLEPQWNKLRARQPEVDELFADDSALAAWLEQARSALRRYFEMEDPARLEPRDRELRLETTLESGLRLRGHLDRLDVAPNGLVRVVDYKTGKAPPPRFSGSARFQIYFYALMVWRELGVVPKRLQLMYLGDGGWLWFEPTEPELRDAEAEIQGVWRDIERTARSGDWQPRPSRLCDWCDHQRRCPAFGGTPPPLPEGVAPRPTS